MWKRPTLRSRPEGGTEGQTPVPGEEKGCRRVGDGVQERVLGFPVVQLEWLQGVAVGDKEQREESSHLSSSRDLGQGGWRERGNSIRTLPCPSSGPQSRLRR